jgi:hypothetical protein
MGLLQPMPNWLSQHLSPAVVTAIIVLSLVLFAATAVAVPWFFCRIPADHYADKERVSLPLVARGSPWRVPLLVLKNVAGVLLVLAGVLMLVLPGQGILTLVIGLLLVDYPGKRRFQRWLVSRRPVYRAINALRKRAHRPPLELEGQPASE